MSVRISSNQVLDAGTQAMDNSLVDATAWQKKLAQASNTARFLITPMRLQEGLGWILILADFRCIKPIKIF